MLGVDPPSRGHSCIITALTHRDSGHYAGHWSPRCKWSLAHFAQFLPPLRSRKREMAAAVTSSGDQAGTVCEESAESVLILVVEFLRLHRWYKHTEGERVCVGMWGETLWFITSAFMGWVPEWWQAGHDPCLWLVEADHVTWGLVSDWASPVRCHQLYEAR